MQGVISLALGLCTEPAGNHHALVSPSAIARCSAYIMIHFFGPCPEIGRKKKTKPEPCTASAGSGLRRTGIKADTRGPKAFLEIMRPNLDKAPGRPPLLFPPFFLLSLPLSTHQPHRPDLPPSFPHIIGSTFSTLTKFPLRKNGTWTK